MLKVYFLSGIPSSGKSTWAKTEVAKNPLNYVRVNNDSIRAATNESEYSQEYEKYIADIRKYMIRQALKKDLNVIIDNVNMGSHLYKEAVEIIKQSNKDVELIEKLFYIDLQGAIERDSKREGKAKVGGEVIKKFWKSSGGEKFKDRQPRTETFYATNTNIVSNNILIQDETAPLACIIDVDGTIAKIGDRSPYSAENCDIVDSLNDHVAKIVEFYFKNNYKIIFCSGRMEKDREPTIRFIEKHMPELKYELFMRETNDFRSDDIVKKEIFNNKIFNKYNIKLVIDDRLRVCKMWYELGLPLLRAGDPEANF